LAYRVRWLSETTEELKRFTPKLQVTVIDKIEKVAAGIPQSLSSKNVVPISGQGRLNLEYRLFEFKINYSDRAAFALLDDKSELVVYLVGNHDYCKRNYLVEASRRLAMPPSEPTSSTELPKPELDR
jgi:hypothetical protein